MQLCKKALFFAIPFFLTVFYVVAEFLTLFRIHAYLSSPFLLEEIGYCIFGAFYIWKGFRLGQTYKKLAISGFVVGLTIFTLIQGTFALLGDLSI